MEDSKRRATLARKSKKIKITHPEKDDETQNCIVCLDKVVCRGKLGVCQHWFCFSCILEWSKVGCCCINKIFCDAYIRSSCRTNLKSRCFLSRVEIMDLSNFKPKTYCDSE